MKKPSATLTLFSNHFKVTKSFDKRFLEHKSLRSKFPDDVPCVVLVVHYAVRSHKEVSVHKLLVSKDTTQEGLLTNIKTRLGLGFASFNVSIEKDKRVFTPFEEQCDGVKIQTVGDMYKEYKENDGFIYLVISIIKNDLKKKEHNDVR